MASKLAGMGKWLRNLAIGDESQEPADTGPMANLDPNYEFMEPFALGAYETQETRRRSRIQIYTCWEQMQRDPTIAAALSLHVTAALGGHESRGDTVFMTPSDAVKNGKGARAKDLAAMIEREALTLVPMFNKIAYSACRKAVGYGDDYARVYSKQGEGVLDLLCDDTTAAYRIQAYEQGSRTVGFHVLEEHEWQRVITKLTTTQMVRLKMPRITPVPQHPILPGVQKRMLDADDMADIPLIPGKVGGSFLYDAEEPWRRVILNLTAMDSQQIADSVKQAFLSVNMSAMPPEQRKKYKAGLIGILQKHKDTIKAAMEGGEQVWATQYHVLPVYDDKQVLNPVGDVSQRSSQVSPENFMINVRRMTGALGMDMSLLGWADMLAGGLGDGAAFHTSAQVMQRSILIRQAFTQFLNDIAILHFGLKYGIQFDRNNLPWKFDFYSDMSAASTEALTNRQTRMNSLTLTAQALGTIKDIGLKGKAVLMLLEDIGGLDTDKAKLLADALEDAQKAAAEAGGGGMPGMGGEGGGGPGGDGGQQQEPDTGDGDLLNEDDENA